MDGRSASLGAGGRRFESCCPDQLTQGLSVCGAVELDAPANDCANETPVVRRCESIHSMRLIHYSTRHLEAVESRSQSKGRAARRCDKPNGLWVSVEGKDDWPSWCRSEEWRTEALVCATHVVLRRDARILHIDTAEALALFHRKYRRVPPIYRDVPTHLRSYGVDWMRIARAYQGIIIAPYQWAMRLDSDAEWYYSWDCASGCLWDASAVSELRALPEQSAVKGG